MDSNLCIAVNRNSKKAYRCTLTNKVISKLRRTNNCNGNESSCYEVLVPSTELETAQDLILKTNCFKNSWED